MTETRRHFLDRFSGVIAKAQFIFTGLFVIVLLVLGSFIYFILNERLIQRAENETTTTTELIRKSTNLYIDNAIMNHLKSIAEKTRDMMAYQHRLFETGKQTEQEAYDKARALILDPRYGKIGTTGYLACVNSRGVLQIHPKSEGVDAGGFDFVKRGMEMKNGYLEYMWRNVGERAAREKVAYLSYFAPWDLAVWATSYKSEFLGLINVDDLAAEINSITIGEKGYSYILDSRGNLVVHPERQGRNIYDNRDARGGYPVREIIARKQGVIRYPGTDPDNTTPNEIASFAYLPDTDWIIVSTVPLDATTSLMKRIRNYSLLVILIASVVVNFFARLSLSRILNPVRHIKKVADAVSGGDLTPRIEETTEDELGQISARFNLLLDHFNKILNKIKRTAEALLYSFNHFSREYEKTIETTNEQAAAVKEVVSTMEDSDDVAKNIAVKIGEVAKIANQTRQSVEKGFSAIQNSLAKMNEIKAANEDRTLGIKSLNDRIENIWEIVTMINDIADQTKIIAFNAELEASSAGDAGRNFKIVASEIRRLADGTVASTTEIKNKINEIQNSSDHLIIASEESTERISEGWKLSHELKAVFEDILSSSEISASSADQIALSIHQQVSAFEQILLTLKQIYGGIDLLAETVQSTNRISKTVADTAHELNRLVAQFTT